MKERTKIRMGALIAFLLLGALCCVFGQDVKVRSFRDEGENKYDSNHYFNLALIIRSDGQLDKTDSITLFINERDSANGTTFMVWEKTDLYLAYDRCYLISIVRDGYSMANLIVNSGVKVKEYGMYIPVNLEKDKFIRSIGCVVWDSRINDVHYYPEPITFR